MSAGEAVSCGGGKSFSLDLRHDLERTRYFGYCLENSSPDQGKQKDRANGEAFFLIDAPKNKKGYRHNKVLFAEHGEEIG